MSQRALWVGVDVGADNMVVCLTDPKGRLVLEQSLPTSAAQLHEVLKSQKRRIRLIAMEAGSYGQLLSRSLRKLGYRVAVFETRQASKFLAIRQNKTDKNDARGLADLGRLGRGSVSEVRVKSVECQRLKSTLVTRQKLVQLRIATDGQIRSLFRLNGGRLSTSVSPESLKRNVRDELKRVRKVAKVDLSEDVEPLVTLSLALRASVEAFDEKLKARAQQNPICQRFLEIPGVGPLCALAFYSTIDDPLRFRRNADVGAYLGMVPKVRQSGKNLGKLRISKMGDRMTRAYLTNAALNHIRFGNSDLALWGASLGKRIGKRCAVTAVARKLGVTMLAMWKLDQAYDPAKSSSS